MNYLGRKALNRVHYIF